MKRSSFELPGFSLFVDRAEQASSKPINLKDENPAFINQLALLNRPELDRYHALASQIRKNFDSALIIGIGGSHLGGETLVTALSKDPAFALHWLNNVDPSAMESAKKFLKGKTPASVVISKSGTTLETLAAFFHLAPHLDPKGLVFITDPQKGTLREIAREKNIATLEIPKDLGGRFSVLSPVGLFPAALCEVPIAEVVEGATKMWETLSRSERNAAMEFARSLYDWDSQGNRPVQYLMPYWQSLSPLAHWFVQLWAESLGKKRRGAPHHRVGPTPVAALGSRDQHSLLQLFVEGPANKVVGFIDVLRSEEPSVIEGSSLGILSGQSFDNLTHQACLATEQSLREVGTPTFRFQLERLTPSALGGLIFFLELSCAYAAELYDVDAYNQPGVEATKRRWKELLQ